MSTSDLWRPTATLATLRHRAGILATIRAFFAGRGVLEVETPALSAATVTDPYLDSFTSTYHGPGAPRGRALFLQTSPEYAMKRLLAAGSGPIFQLCKSFRDGEAGSQHNPEFTMLEWYRPGFDHHALMDEMDGFLAATLDAAPAERLSYGQAFDRWVGVDAHRASAAELALRAGELGIALVQGFDPDDRDVWLQILMSDVVEPQLGRPLPDGRARPAFIYDYPASQAALARLRTAGDVRVAERFEVYVAGVELANGFHELADAAEQRRRFERDLERRRAIGKPATPIDEHLLAALASGEFPDCSGVALGVDRLVMLATGARSLPEVMAFPFDRA
jgi:lysyl-tRNA synthetase class 2